MAIYSPRVFKSDHWILTSNTKSISRLREDQYQGNHVGFSTPRKNRRMRCHGFGPHLRHTTVRFAWSADLHDRQVGDAGTSSSPHQREQVGGLLINGVWLSPVLAMTSLQSSQSFHYPVNRSVRLKLTLYAHLLLSFYPSSCCTSVS